jgi:uncharacterized protein YfaA (DUF2138 family)
MSINDLTCGEPLDVAALLKHANTVSSVELTSALIGALTRIAVLEQKAKAGRLADAVLSTELYGAAADDPARVALYSSLSEADGNLRYAVTLLEAPGTSDYLEAVTMIRGARAVLVRIMDGLRKK